MTYKSPISWALAIFSCSPSSRTGLLAASAIRSALTKEGANPGANDRSWPVLWPDDLPNPLNEWMGGMPHHGGSTVALSRGDTPDGRGWGRKAGQRIGELLLEREPDSLFLVMAWCPNSTNYQAKRVFNPSCKLVAGGNIFENTHGLEADYRSSPVNLKEIRAWRGPDMVMHLARARLASAVHRVPALLQWRASMMASQWPQPLEETTPTATPHKPRF